MSNPLLYGRLILPVDGSASNPSIQMGGGPVSNTGTGIYGTMGEVNIAINGQDMLRINEDGMLGPSAPYEGEGSFQPIAIDLELGEDAGADAPDTSFLAPIMGNLLGADLTKDANYLAGVIGALSITGSKSSDYPVGALMGILMDGVTDADGIVVAVLDGSDPSAETRANAGFKLRGLNNHEDSGVDYGLDLYSPALSPFDELVIAKADIRMSNQVCLLNGAGVPVDGTTGDNFAGPGSIYIDITNQVMYMNTGSISNPVWEALAFVP